MSKQNTSERISIWHNQIDMICEQFRREFGLIDSNRMNWKPNQKTWSIGQNIDHLLIINETYFDVIRRINLGTYKFPKVAKWNLFNQLLGKEVLKVVQPDVRKKMKTFPIWEPAQIKVSSSVLQKFIAQEYELKVIISASHNLIEQNVIISYPPKKMVVYPLETAFDIIIAHQQRHLEQAKAVKNLIRKF